MRIMAWVMALGLLPIATHAETLTQWKRADPENTLVVDTAAGQIFIELRPEAAPKAVERVKLLTRRGTYDGLQFWRVVPKFVVQIDVGNTEGGKTELPNLAPEFRFRIPKTVDYPVAAHPQGLEAGFIGATPYIAVEKGSTATPAPADGSRSAWVSYCTGVAGMGRDASNDTANAELFFMTGAYPALDRLFTPVGRIVYGQQHLEALPPGEPPQAPQTLRTIRVLADVPNAPVVEVLDTSGSEFAARVKAVRKERGADFSICDVAVPSRVMP
jgi:peptidylprolyl isomerase